MTQARRNPSRAATKSHAGVRVYSLPGPRILQQRCTCSGTNEAQKPVPYCRLADSVGASRTSGNASYRLCAQIKDERAYSDGVTGWSGVAWQASWKIRVSSVGSRDTLVAMRLHNDFSGHGKAIRLAECGRC